MLKFKTIMNEFKDKRILVVGDYYLDENIVGKTVSIAPEGPFPRLRVEKQEFSPGAAGNVAKNAQAMGAKVYAVGVIGDDYNGRIMLDIFKQKGINTYGLVVNKNRVTGTFTKLIAKDNTHPEQQVYRFDYENKFPIDDDTKEEIVQKIEEILPEVDAVIVADYDEANGTGLISQDILLRITQISKKHSKISVGISRQKIGQFKDFTIVIPNEIESAKATGLPVVDNNSAEKSARNLIKQLSLKYAVLTRGKQGMSIFDGESVEHIPSYADEVVDVCGAGDTVTAALTISLISGASIFDAAKIANHAAAESVKKYGAQAVSAEEIIENIRSKSMLNKLSKVKSVIDLAPLLDNLKNDNKKIVFTNGFFDLLNRTHIEFLRKAKQHGDILVVAINSDESCRANKGYDRPYMPQNDRAELLSALEFIDYVTIFNEITPLKILSQLKPDVLVKGGTYNINEVIGKDIIESYGGKVAMVPYIQNISTQDIVHSIRNNETRL